MKSEIRNPKSETNSKFENEFQNAWPCRMNFAVPRFEFSAFPIRICFGFRISDFGFSSTRMPS